MSANKQFDSQWRFFDYYKFPGDYDYRNDWESRHFDKIHMPATPSSQRKSSRTSSTSPYIWQKGKCYICGAWLDYAKYIKLGSFQYCSGSCYAVEHNGKPWSGFNHAHLPDMNMKSEVAVARSAEVSKEISQAKDAYRIASESLEMGYPSPKPTIKKPSKKRILYWEENPPHHNGGYAVDEKMHIQAHALS